jgi:hypothetical protein
MGINSFDEAAALYARVKPLNGGRNTASLNVRPVGPRGRFMDRIARVDDIRYIMLDGLIPVAMAYTPDTVAFRNAPILWQREGDQEMLRIRHEPEGINPIAREKFLQAVLPDCMTLRKSDGNTFIDIDGKEFYLPRPKPYFLASDYFDPSCLWFARPLPTDSSSPLRGGAWQRAGKPVDLRLTTLDKDLVRKFKPAINEFYEYMGAVLPVLGGVDLHTFDRHGANFVPRSYGKPLHPHVDLTNLSHNLTQKVRSVILDSQHLNRLDLAVMLAKALNLYRRAVKNTKLRDEVFVDVEYEMLLCLPETVEHARYVRSTYLKLMYKAADLYAKRTY